jgi:deoxyribose-phosphate aldolase
MADSDDSARPASEAVRLAGLAPEDPRPDDYDSARPASEAVRLAGLAPEDLAPLIDHTLLRADATPAEVEELCAQAVEWGFHAVCVNTRFVARAAAALAASEVCVCAVVGFPLGAASTQAKLAEALIACEDGARELDMVMAIGEAKAKNWDVVAGEIAALALSTRERALLKVIIECSLLTDAEKVRACQVAIEAGAAFVKTSTGFSAGGATTADVRLMREVVGPTYGVKASGGIRTRADALAMCAAGANRLGTSNGIAIVSPPPS